MPEIGLITTGAPQDPRPSIRIESDRIVEMDQKSLEEFDLIDHFIAMYSIDITMAPSAMAENLIAMLWDLECASGNDTPWSGSSTRDVAHALPWIISGTDIIHSGFGATPVSDNMFGGSCFNIENLDDELAIPRDLILVAVIKGFAKRGETEIAGALLDLVKQRIAGDYLQTAAIFDRDLNCISAINDPNDYAGPSTGFRIDSKRWDEIKTIRQAKRPKDIKDAQTVDGGLSFRMRLTMKIGGPAWKGHRPDEVVIGVSPAFGKTLNKTLSGLYVGEALYEIRAGIEEEGCRSRVIRIEYSTELLREKNR